MNELPPYRKPPNSTSSLYIETTIAKPDVVEMCFCASIVIHDLILQANEAKHTLQLSHSLFRPQSMFSSLGKRARSTFEGRQQVTPVDATELPTEHDIRFLILDVFAIANFSPGCLVVALIYIERLRLASGAMLFPSTWRPTLLISILVAQKVWEDRKHLNVDFTLYCPELTLQQLNLLERDFLRLIDYKVGVTATIYTNWYFRLRSLCDRHSLRIHPLDGDEARLLEIGSDRYASHVRDVARAQSGPLPYLGGSFATPKRPTRAVIS